MRCSYCGGLNRDQSTFCMSCGRDMRGVPPYRPQQPQAPHQPARSGAQPQSRPVNTPNPQAQRGNAPAPQAQTAGRRNPAPVSMVQTPPQPVAPPPAPEPPAPFPPRTMEQLNALLATGAQPYAIVESLVGDGKKKIVRIAYANSAAWQQAATLYKALKEQQEEQYNTIIIQGFLPQQADVYAFTNGQLQFDRAVRLGGQIGSRYVVETGNGFASDSVRFVLNA